MTSWQNQTAVPTTLEIVRDSVWHYTSAAGLIGVIRDQRLWASEARTLNDISEITRGLEAVQNWVTGNSTRPGVGEMAEAVERLTSQGGNTYILSASLEGDDAGQWRLYAAGSKGYAVELDASCPLVVLSEESGGPRQPGLGWFLRDSVEITPWLKVFYDDASLHQALEKIADHAFSGMEALESTDWSDSYPDAAVDAREELFFGIYAAVAAVASVFKSSAFRGEAEARIVVTLSSKGLDHVLFRPSDHGVTPYVTLGPEPQNNSYGKVRHPDHVGDRKLPVKSVTLGPGLHNLNVGATEDLVRKAGYKRDSVTVAKAQSPLRR